MKKHDCIAASYVKSVSNNKAKGDSGKVELTVDPEVISAMGRTWPDLADVPAPLSCADYLGEATHDLELKREQTRSQMLD